MHVLVSIIHKGESEVVLLAPIVGDRENLKEQPRMRQDLEVVRREAMTARSFMENFIFVLFSPKLEVVRNRGY